MTISPEAESSPSGATCSSSPEAKNTAAASSESLARRLEEADDAGRLPAALPCSTTPVPSSGWPSSSSATSRSLPSSSLSRSSSRGPPKSLCWKMLEHSHTRLASTRSGADGLRHLSASVGSTAMARAPDVPTSQDSWLLKVGCGTNSNLAGRRSCSGSISAVSPAHANARTARLGSTNSKPGKVFGVSQHDGIVWSSSR
mmetsp:Transcript_10412/g.33278  ORF Transcript_10412/g.33278 Transcript_10412/m.33278 type:complete len:200 (-) Transcript_10412:2768-3367(-)